ncbi:hypothetical protein ACSBR2_006049 [Camellia fascicularis]|uniref:DNA replication complex GINS protein PSF3 n=1 Tax=Camellia lanceoleosa TaxID=1840588 RepID=A0ACC0ICU7_9ERIC|nr:DNA replication complex GINS protein PSF3 [Camellia lanceoleosa]
MSQYYDIDDIIAEDELVPAVFQVSANGVGLFDSSDETNKVEQGSKVELPFWLARELHLRQAVSINLPHCFNQKTREELAADAAHVDLRNRCPYFYELGRKLFTLVGDKTIGTLLLAAFQTRYREVLIKAQTAALAVAPKFLTLLTKEETKLYEAAQSSMVAFKKWRMGGPRFQKASVLGRKRRPFE